jgi:hypothetical protein
MDWIRNLFVRAKHWQLFLLFVAVFVIGELPMLGYVASGPKSPEDPAEAFVVVEIVTAVSALCYLLWLWSMGSFLNSLIPPTLRSRIHFFSFTVIFTSIYVLGFIAFFQSVSPIAVCGDHSAAAPRRFLHVLQFLFRVKKLGKCGNRQERDFQRICRDVFSAVVLPYRHLVYPAADQSALRQDAER